MRIWLLTATLLASPAAAAPVYLACEFPREGGDLPIEIVADEVLQTASVFLPTTGRLVTRRALFSPTSVSIPDEESTWLVDRVSLSLARRVAIGGTLSTEEGKCAVKPPPAKRAF